MPFDQFVRWQIAGELTPNAPLSARAGTGFFAVGPTYNGDGGDAEASAAARAETLSDRVDTFSRAFLGLTVACARCHDHKFDPVSIKDYYAIAGVFNNTSIADKPLALDTIVRAYDDHQNKIKNFEKQIKKFESFSGFLFCSGFFWFFRGFSGFFWFFLVFLGFFRVFLVFSGFFGFFRFFSGFSGFFRVF